MENNNLSDQYFNETKNLKEELERYKISYKIKKFYDENTCLGMKFSKKVTSTVFQSFLDLFLDRRYRYRYIS